MTTRTHTNRNTRNIPTIRRIEILIHQWLDYSFKVCLWGMALFTAIIIAVIIATYFLIQTGVLTTEHISYITGDSYIVFRLHGVEFHSVQLTGNWLQQCFDIVVNVLGSIVQSIRNTF